MKGPGEPATTAVPEAGAEPGVTAGTFRGPEERGAGAPPHVLASSSPADERTRVLKHADTFVVFDRYGDIKPGGLGEEGLYQEGTRFLSCLFLELEGMRPFFLGSTVRDENDQLVVALTNPDRLDADGQLRLPLGTLHLSVKKFLWQRACYQEFRIENHGLDPVRTEATLYFAADFADIFEVRGMKRASRGRDLEPELADAAVLLAYRGLDDVVRRTHLRFTPPPTSLTASIARFDLHLAPQEQTTFRLVVGCEREAQPLRRVPFEEARGEMEADLERFKAWSCHIRTSNGQINAWTDRAVSDLHMMTTELPTGPFPYAGVPWFNTPFGRDGLITALECLWFRPSLARGVLAYLAATQATEVVPEQDAEPGKIQHETRSGEMAALHEMPFGKYYGSVDAPPLFVILAGAYFQRTGDLAFVESIWPHLEAALDWMERYGDRDGDGFLEYDRANAAGLLHQGWKDSDDAVFHADGALADPPIALCEVQAYAYAALRSAALLGAARGRASWASEQEEKARVLQERFESAFWDEELGTYVLALDGGKRPCRVRSSNPGQCLFTGIVRPDRAQKMARTLFAPESFSGWGIRTIAADERRYNPMGYHTGTVWPHDNALIALGLARYGFMDKALLLLNGQFEAGLHFEFHRMPELFCGFPQRPGEGPILYPVACSPQAWSAGSVFLLLQAALGLEVDARRRRITLNNPRLPASLGELRIHNLQVAESAVDLLLVRHENNVGINVLRREGEVSIVAIK